MGSTGLEDAQEVAIDSNNNVYITGFTRSSLDGTNAGGNDAFLVKYDSTGIKVWTRQLGSTVSDVAYRVAIDSNNNVYITGSTSGSLDGSNAGSIDAFLAKYDSTGSIIWTRQMGSTGEDIAFSVAIDSNNNVYISGYTFGSLDGTNAGLADAFLAKYDSTGIKVWTRQLGSTVSESATSVAIDSNNNVYITGSTDGSLDGTNAGSRDAFLAKYDSTGSIIWTRQLGSTTEDRANSVAIDSNNNVYITGYTRGSLDGTNAGSNDAFLVKYDSTGIKVWTRQLGSTVSDIACSVAIDSNNNVYITGYTFGSLDGTNAGSADAFLAMYDSTGNKVWTRQLGLTGEDITQGVAIDSNNNVYITGYTAGSLDGTNAGSSDAFLAKYIAPAPAPEPEPEPAPAPAPEPAPEPAPVVPLDTSVINQIEGQVPTVNTSVPVIEVNVPVSLLTSGTVTEKSQKRTTFLAKLFTDNVGLASASGKITMTKEKLLGDSSVITKNTMVIKKATNTEVAQNTSQLASDEAIYVYMSNGDFTVFDTTGGKLKITKISETQYNIYENYVDSNSPVTKTMSVGESSSLGTFTYVVGGVSGQISSSAPTPAPAPICFPKGTPVVTNQGNVAIEKLNPDIHTIRNKRIVAITQTRPLFTHIVSIEKDALGKNVPSATTQISNEHKVYYKGKMMKAVELVRLCKGVTLIPYNGETLYNVLMEKHDNMMINNLICETLHPENIMAKICNGKYNSSEKNRICEELTEIIKKNNFKAYKKLYASLK
jgi:hypothetical protein